MNILITAISSATGPSGICRHAYNLARCAASNGDLQVTLAFGKWQELYFRNSFNMDTVSVTIVSIDIPNSAFARNMWYLRELPKLADGVAADIVHLSFPVPIRRSMMRCPVVVSLHDLYPYDEPSNFGFPRVFFNRVFLQQCLREVDCVACVSETTLCRLRERFPRFAQRKAVVIHNCVTIGSAEPALPVGQRGKFVLMVAQHRANKNILLALRAFEEFLQRQCIDQVSLVLVGNQGPETAAIRTLIGQLSLERSVKLIDGVTDGELRWLYENCEFLIVPSSMEGFGLPVVEGLSCGSRVVCSDIPVFREIGGDACIYFDLHAELDSSAIVDGICYALSEPARQAKRLERFLPGNIAREYAALYSELREDALGRV
ncbi:MAG: glycosyltransferase family 1 protein [Edaphobacter sp.]|nr:glycosyltransferase family 1 protein [Edaphobacter sp.]